MHEIRITSKQTFQETENCRKMDLLALKTLTVPQTNDFGFSNCIGSFLGKILSKTY